MPTVYNIIQKLQKQSFSEKDVLEKQTLQKLTYQFWKTPICGRSSWQRTWYLPRQPLLRHLKLNFLADK